MTDRLLAVIRDYLRLAVYALIGSALLFALISLAVRHAPTAIVAAFLLILAVVLFAWRPLAGRRQFSAKPATIANQGNSCTDPIVGAILSGWRYDISNISPEMRTDYEQHLTACPDCRKRRRNARIFDFAILAGMLLSMAAFLLMTLVLRRVESLVHITAVRVNLHHTPITISMEVLAVTGLIVSTVIAGLVAIATPIPNLVTGAVREHVPLLRERLARRHA